MNEQGRISINFIIPYFGRFPNYFQLFLNSCKENPDIDWTIITDNREKYSYPDNVHIVQGEFEKVRDRIRNTFEPYGFYPCIEEVHKLCEYKPAYGFLFPELIEGYDFWGYCDIDVIYGRIRKFITDDILTQFSKIGILGHLTIIKNQDAMNRMFMRDYNGHALYKEAFSSTSNYNFDEEFQGKPNINSLFRQNNVEVMDLERYIADIYPNSSVFRRARGTTVEKPIRAFFVWDEGKLYRMYKVKECDGNTLCRARKQEFLYIHLQKRDMKMKISDTARCYKIIPNSFECISHPNDLSSYAKEKIWNPNMHYFRIRSKNLVIKIINLIRVIQEKDK